MPMLPYQYCGEKKEGRKEWMAIGPGEGTPNRIKNRLCVWSGMAVENMPIEVNIYVFIKSLTPKSRIIFKHVVGQRLECCSYIMYSVIHSMQEVIPHNTKQLKGEVITKFARFLFSVPSVSW